jgi:hypothetical protein
MDYINRSAVTLRPKQPYLEWTRLDDTTGIADVVHGSMNQDPTVFLLPGYENDEEQQDVLQEFWPVLFEAMLDGWLRDPGRWPQDRTFKMFEEWFDVQMLSTVRDAYLDEAIEYAG